MPKDEVKFVVSKQTDTSFQSALKLLKDNFPNWRVIGIHREVIQQNGVDVTQAVIEIEFP
jgi:predicted protein tyrosine phosphatase